MKPTERTFFKICYLLTQNRMFTIREIMGMFEGVIPRNQMIYYLKKWTNKGFYEYGVTLDLGWFIPREVPDRYFK